MERICFSIIYIVTILSLFGIIYYGGRQKKKQKRQYGDNMSILLALMDSMDSDAERHGIIRKISNKFCIHCGSKDVPCSCWKDE